MGGAYKQKESKEFQLRYEKGVLIFGDKNQEIDLENFELGDDSEVYNSFITFLRTKLHNVDKGLASKSTKQYSNSTKGEKNYNTYKANPESKYVEVILDESLDHLAESTVWDTYNSYLLTPRTDKRLSPLRTRQKSILPNNGATSLDAPTHKGGYWSFESNMNTASVFTKEGQKPKTASADRQQESWTKEDNEDSRVTGQELGAMAADQGVETKTVDITDIQDTEEVTPTWRGNDKAQEKAFTDAWLALDNEDYDLEVVDAIHGGRNKQKTLKSSRLKYKDEEGKELAKTDRVLWNQIQNLIEWKATKNDLKKLFEDAELAEKLATALDEYRHLNSILPKSYRAVQRKIELTDIINEGFQKAAKDKFGIDLVIDDNIDRKLLDKYVKTELQPSSEVDTKKKTKKKGKGVPSQKMSNADIVALQKRMGVKKVDGLGFTKKSQAPKGKGTSDQKYRLPFWSGTRIQLHSTL